MLQPTDREAAFILFRGKPCGFHGEDSLVRLFLRPPTLEYAHWEIPVTGVAGKPPPYCLQINFSAEVRWNKGTTITFSMAPVLRHKDEEMCLLP